MKKMKQFSNNKALVRAFIETIWNECNFKELDLFIHPAFKDLSLPPVFTDDKEGMKKWIQATSNAFEHHTTIEDIVAEDDKVIVKILMTLKHVGFWRNIPATGRVAVTH